MRPAHRRVKALWICAPALSLFLSSCGISTEFTRSLDADVARGDYGNALETVRDHRKAYGDKSSVLYNLDMGLLFHYAGQQDSSTAYLLAAEREIEDLYTRSVSLEAMSLLLNDNVLPYEGEDFEKVLVNIFLALNFAEKGEEDEAVVEARKVDLKLREYARQYEGKNAYQEDAFARYLSGVLYESNGEINDAFISYRKAHEAYETYAAQFGTPAPDCLLDDLVRTAGRLGFTEDALHYQELGGKAFDRSGVTAGSLVVVAYAGLSPIKSEVRSSVSIADGDGTIHTFQIALPKFTPRYAGSRTYAVQVRGNRDSLAIASAQTRLAEDVTAIASRVLDDRLALVYLKSGGRALLKFLAAEKAKAALKKSGGGSESGERSGNTLVNLLGSLALDIVVGATEKADVRTWRTLPAQFQVSRLMLEPGAYTVGVESSDGGYSLPAEAVTIRAGKTTFLLVDDIR
ncbi:MAG: hypothetical protein H6Q32_638 [Bacteroidetes bacterium]|nr:hypothetical protein [Bacteroidota bacterium]